MGGKEAKTGQGVDIVKQRIIHPVIVEQILNIPDLPIDLSLIDLGTGDATSCQDLLMPLLHSGYRIKNLALVDADLKVFPYTVGTVTSGPINFIDTQIVQAGSRNVVAEFLMHFEEKYDVALSQLVLHQVESDHDASYLMYMAYQALKPNGNLMVLNLHPKYLDYLSENEPGKFRKKDSSGNRITGTYNFDSAGSAEVYSRNPEYQLAMFLGIGFDFVKFIPIYTDSLKDEKPRYHGLSENTIPMFYLLNLRKNPQYFISSTRGTVAKIERFNDNWVTVSFKDGNEINIPSFNNWEKVVEGDHLYLHETRCKEINTPLLNYWVIDANEKVRSGQLITRVNS